MNVITEPSYGPMRERALDGMLLPRARGEETVMFGTIARAKIKPENRMSFEEVMRTQMSAAPIDGFVAGYTVWPEKVDDEVMLVAIFRDRESYMRNADDPAQDARFREMRALLESDPEWMDGEFQEG
jgi:quinol monooxygenase YgiN